MRHKPILVLILIALAALNVTQAVAGDQRDQLEALREDLAQAIDQVDELLDDLPPEEGDPADDTADDQDEQLPGAGPDLDASTEGFTEVDWSGSIDLPIDVTERQALGALAAHKKVRFAAGGVYDFALVLPRGSHFVGVHGEGDHPRFNVPVGRHGIDLTNDKINGLVIQGLHLVAPDKRQKDIHGISLRINASGGKYAKGLVIEDNVIIGFDANIKLVDSWARKQGEGKSGRIQATIRRNIIRYATGSDAHSIGVYLEGTRDTVVEENLIDHNGWARGDGFEVRNKASHNIYAQTFNGPVTVRRNILTRGAASGLQLRAGGVIEGNLFVRNAMAFWTAINDSKAINNVVLESDDMDPDVPKQRRGMGIEGWGMDRFEVVGNIVARRVGSLQKPGIGVSAKKELIVKDNKVYDWQDNRVGVSLDLAGRGTRSGNISQEDFDGNEPPFVDPERSVGSYAETIGLDATLEAFLDAAAARPRGQWIKALSADAVCDYIRAGFELNQVSRRAYAEHPLVIEKFAEIGLKVRPIVVLYGRDLFDVNDPAWRAPGNNIRDHIASDTTETGPFLRYRANPASSYWQKIKIARETGCPVILDIEPQYGQTGAGRAAYKAASNHVIDNVEQDAPNSIIMLYDSPVRQEPREGANPYHNEESIQADIAAYNAEDGPYRRVDVPCIRAYQSYKLGHGFTADLWVPHMVSQARDAFGVTPWAQVWAEGYDAITKRHSYPDHPDVMSEEETQRIAHELVAAGVQHVVLFHRQRDYTEEGIAHSFGRMRMLLKPFAEKIEP